MTTNVLESYIVYIVWVKTGKSQHFDLSIIADVVFIFFPDCDGVEHRDLARTQPLLFCDSTQSMSRSHQQVLLESVSTNAYYDSILTEMC